MNAYKLLFQQHAYSQWAMTLFFAISAAASPFAYANGYKMQVVYTQPDQNGCSTIHEHFGLASMPASITADYTLGEGFINTEPGEEDNIVFYGGDVLQSSVQIGNDKWDSLSSFYMTMKANSLSVTDLGYQFQPIILQATSESGITLNFPFTIRIENSQNEIVAECVYAESDASVTPLPIEVDIDIKPGGYPNCFNINGHGVIPVAVLGSSSFDVSQIDPSSLSFGGLTVRVRGNKEPQCAFEDSNMDGYPDLVCQFEDDPVNWAEGEDQAELTGTTLEGIVFHGTDSICINPS